MKLYYHKTDGGAEYLTDTFVPWKHNGKSGKEGTLTDKTKYIIRIDGNIEEDAEMTIAIPDDIIKKETYGWDCWIKGFVSALLLGVIALTYFSLVSWLI